MGFKPRNKQAQALNLRGPRIIARLTTYTIREYGRQGEHVRDVAVVRGYAAAVSACEENAARTNNLVTSFAPRAIGATKDGR